MTSAIAVSREPSSSKNDHAFAQMTVRHERSGRTFPMESEYRWRRYRTNAAADREKA